MDFSNKIYGIRWGKTVNKQLQIIYEQNNLFNLSYLKETIQRIMDPQIIYFVCKEQHNHINGYTFSRYTWLQCEKEYIYSIEAETVLEGLAIS